MVHDTPSRHQDQFVLRTPDGMRERIAQAAKANNRSMNSEIVAILETALLNGTKSSPNILASLIEAQTGQLQITNTRLDELIALLAPKDPAENPLGDLLAHLLMLGREQLTLARQTLDEISKLSEDPSLSSHHPVLPASNGGHAA
ncbi:MAG TPA: Arc family DNA-binding protein [Methylocella sp.]|nr:Arc family DNA-binding protein [Methylocella sp.]